MVEELLELLIAEVDAELLKTIELKDFKSSNVQDTDEDSFLHGVVHKSVVTLFNNEVEDSSIETPGDARHRLVRLVAVLTLGDPLSSNLDLGLAERLHHQLVISSKESGDLLSLSRSIRLTLLLSSLLLEFLNIS